MCFRKGPPVVIFAKTTLRTTLGLFIKTTLTTSLGVVFAKDHPVVFCKDNLRTS